MQRFLKSWTGAALASAGAVAVATGLVYALRPVAPDLSLGVLYVLRRDAGRNRLRHARSRSARRSPACSRSTCSSSRRCTRFTLRDPRTGSRSPSTSGPRSWSASSRRGRAGGPPTPSSAARGGLLAEIATHLLEGRRLDDQLDWIGARAARDPRRRRRPASSSAAGGAAAEGRAASTASRPTARSSARSTPTSTAEADLEVRKRFLPALASLLAVADERER